MTGIEASPTASVIAALIASALYVATYFSFVRLLRYPRNWLPPSLPASLATGVLAALTVALVSLSPDGKRIAFVRGADIYVMNADGTDVGRLVENAYSPAWSPDGTRIAFVSGRDGNEEIYVMNADGSGQTRLTDNLAHDGFPAWSPVP